MQLLPPRIVVHVFARKPLSKRQLAQAHDFISRSYAAEGRRLVELIIDTGPPKQDAADHPSLLAIARGDADGIILMEYPITPSPTPNRDILHAHLQGPFTALSAAELADRGLIPGGTRYRKLGAVERATARAASPDSSPLWKAARRAAELRAQYLPLRKIAEVLEQEGYRPRRGGKWHVGTVAHLLKSHPAMPARPLAAVDHHI